MFAITDSDGYGARIRSVSGAVSGSSAERIVQQVIEDLAIQPRGFAQITLEIGQGRAALTFLVAGADRQPAQFLVIVRKHVGLEVEHDLQAVLDFAQEAVVVLQDVPLLHGQAADFLEPRDGLQRVAGPNLLQTARR